MSFIDIFGLTTLPAGISVVFLLLNRKNIGEVIMKYDKEYLPKYNIKGHSYIIKSIQKT